MDLLWMSCNICSDICQCNIYNTHTQNYRSKLCIKVLHSLWYSSFDSVFTSSPWGWIKLHLKIQTGSTWYVHRVTAMSLLQRSTIIHLKQFAVEQDWQIRLPWLHLNYSYFLTSWWDTSKQPWGTNASLQLENSSTHCNCTQIIPLYLWRLFQITLVIHPQSLITDPLATLWDCHEPCQAYSMMFMNTSLQQPLEWDETHFWGAGTMIGTLAFLLVSQQNFLHK